MFNRWGDPTATNQELSQADHQLAETVGLMEEGSLGIAESVQELYKLDKAQGKQIAQLSALVTALVEIIIESGVASQEAVMTKLSAALSSAEAVQEKADNQVQCDSCGNSVLRNTTYLSESGTVCSRCYSP